jgi:hypothetical protein
MTVLDTHIWVWWVNGSTELSPGKRQILASRQADGLGVSVISCWEIAKLVEKGRLALAVPVGSGLTKPWLIRESAFCHWIQELPSPRPSCRRLFTMIRRTKSSPRPRGKWIAHWQRMTENCWHTHT